MNFFVLCFFTSLTWVFFHNFKYLPTSSLLVVAWLLWMSLLAIYVSIGCWYACPCVLAIAFLWDKSVEQELLAFSPLRFMRCVARYTLEKSSICEYLCSHTLTTTKHYQYLYSLHIRGENLVLVLFKFPFLWLREWFRVFPEVMGSVCFLMALERRIEHMLYPFYSPTSNYTFIHIIVFLTWTLSVFFFFF